LTQPILKALLSGMQPKEWVANLNFRPSSRWKFSGRGGAATSFIDRLEGFLLGTGVSEDDVLESLIVYYYLGDLIRCWVGVAKSSTEAVTQVGGNWSCPWE
jgi:hypothetical protein